MTASSEVRLGLWLSQRGIWVKGVGLNGVVVNGNASFGMCIKFRQLETGERDRLGEFRKYVPMATGEHQERNG